MRFKGKITNWNDDKGFGFVEPNGGGSRSFVHIKSFKMRSRRPVDGDLIIYKQVKENNGKFKAVNIGLVNDCPKPKGPHKDNPTFGMVLVVSFFISLSIAFFTKFIPFEIVLLYILVSVLTFIVYALDKSAAKSNRWRVAESHLHLISLIGGWPGALYAQRKLRHKSSKKDFKQVYWVTVVINLCGFIWLLSARGQQFINITLG